MMMTLMNTGNCLVIVPSYARPQKVEAMKNGSSGMMIVGDDGQNDVLNFVEQRLQTLGFGPGDRETDHQRQREARS